MAVHTATFSSTISAALRAIEPPACRHDSAEFAGSTYGASLQLVQQQQHDQNGLETFRQLCYLAYVGNGIPRRFEQREIIDAISSPQRPGVKCPIVSTGELNEKGTAVYLSGKNRDLQCKSRRVKLRYRWRLFWLPLGQALLAATAGTVTPRIGRREGRSRVEPSFDVLVAVPARGAHVDLSQVLKSILLKDSGICGNRSIGDNSTRLSAVELGYGWVNPTAATSTSWALAPGVQFHSEIDSPPATWREGDLQLLRAMQGLPGQRGQNRAPAMHHSTDHRISATGPSEPSRATHMKVGPPVHMVGGPPQYRGACTRH
eukprot:1348757-Amphidinium_carterae.1